MGFDGVIRMGQRFIGWGYSLYEEDPHGRGTPLPQDDGGRSLVARGF